MATPAAYSSIPNDVHEDEHDANKTEKRLKRFKLALMVLLATVALCCIFIVLLISGVFASKATTTSSSSSTNTLIDQLDLRMPYGVNFGSWLSLEDYFFVGDRGAVEVATPTDGVKAAQCLPPLNLDQAWFSETDLFQQLSDAHDISHAIRTFHAYRVSYMDLEHELATIASLGIQRVRVPMAWCLTAYDPAHDELLLSTQNLSIAQQQTLLDRYTCVDPLLAQENVTVHWPALPKSFVVNFLQACGRHHIKAILDIHTYPGGTSLGTFSGVWPRPPVFWKYDLPETETEDVGRTLFRSFLDWIQSLDDNVLLGLGGITPMNEPGHLAGLFGPGSVNPNVASFLPSLPTELEQDYLQKLQQSDHDGDNLVSVPAGHHLRVLKWQSDAVDAFRSTLLPAKGIELVVNVHESIFVQALVTADAADDAGRHPYATGLLAAWWRGTTTAEERSAWAVLDIHHYHAWEPSCQGSVDGSGGYVCGDEAQTDHVLEQCASWTQVFRDAGREQFPDEDGTAKLSSGEFSASTHHSVLLSCLDVTTLRKSYMQQIEAAEAANVQLYWWSWKMPYGGAFRPAWSFRHLLHLLGVFSQPDTSVVPCGES